jgi:hypothetical protein
MNVRLYLKHWVNPTGMTSCQHHQPRQSFVWYFHLSNQHVQRPRKCSCSRNRVQVSNKNVMPLNWYITVCVRNGYINAPGIKKNSGKDSRARKRCRALYLNFLWECGTKHKCLSIASFWHCILFHNPSDLRFKSHIQHTICLVQHQKPVDERLSNQLQLRMPSLQVAMLL